MKRDRRQKLGRRAEDTAVRYLRSNGYRILHRNYWTPVGEVDIVAVHQNVLCFVEVRSTSGADIRWPLQSIAQRKRAKVEQVARYIISKEGYGDMAVRFDAVGVRVGRLKSSVLLIQQAWEARSEF